MPVRRRADQGQTASELLGMIVVVAVLAAALVAMPAGQQVVAGIKAAICRIIGGSCSTDPGAKQEASATVAVTGGGGVRYDFTTEQAARDFITATQHQLVKDGIASSNPVTSWGPGRDLVMWGMDTIDGVSYDPPDPTETWIQGGLKVDASAASKTCVMDGGVEVNASAVLGVRQNHRSGNTTRYYQVAVLPGGRSRRGAAGPGRRGRRRHRQGGGPVRGWVSSSTPTTSRSPPPSPAPAR